MGSKNSAWDWGELLKLTLELGLVPSEFWDLTPAETIILIEARSQSRRDAILQTAWLTAKLSRAKRIPPIKQLLSPPPAKRLHGKELKRRRTEFEDMTRSLDVKKVTKSGDKDA